MSVYGAVRIFLQTVTGSYFRKIQVKGLENIPKEGPTIICCNHSNQFMDAMLVIARCPRPLSFCFAASSYSKPVIGYFAKKINVIPVYRPDDYKVAGKGKIKLISESEILGLDTHFISETKSNKNFELGVHQIAFGNHYKATVVQIIDENHIKIKSDPELFDNLEKEPDKTHQFYFIPKIDNSILYSEAYKKLDEGKAICIFPEGTSHDNTHFLELKAGIGFMSLGAMTINGTKHIKLVPCGLTYVKRDEFRSDVIVEFGNPYEIPEEWGKLYKTNKREAIGKVLKVTENLMKSVTVTMPTYRDYFCMKLATDIYIPSNLIPTPEDTIEITRRFSQMYECFKDEPEIKAIRRSLFKYKDSLESVGLEDYDLRNIQFNYTYFVKKTLKSFLLFHVYVLLSLPAIIVTVPVIWYVKKYSENERLKALEKNPNKYKAKDVVSSVKVTTFFKFIPIMIIFWLIIGVAFTKLYIESKFSVEFSLYKTVIFFSLICPFYSYFSLLMYDSLYFYLETMKQRFMFFCYPRNIYRLKDSRKEIKDKIWEFVGSVASETQYANNRIISPYGAYLKQEKNKAFNRPLKNRIKMQVKKFFSKPK